MTGPDDERPRPPRRRLPPWWLLVVVGLVVVVLLSFGGRWIYDQVATCGPDVKKIGGQCIGVTDGSARLAPEFRDLLNRIAIENDRVQTSGQPWVSVGYLMPMPIPGSPAALELPALRHELEGALVGQLEANQTRSILGERPLIKLLVANGGDSMQQWRAVVPTLTSMAQGSGRFAVDRLVAVVATGQSLRSVQDALTDLTDARVPVITSRLAADEIVTSPSIDRPLARVTPVNTDGATALAAYARSRGSRGLLVQNASKDDTYARSLGTAFSATFPDAGHVLLRPTETYNPGADVDTMASVLRNVCAQRPDVVFFAGRATELLPFVEALPRRTCQDQPITVVTGSDAVDFATALPQSNISVQDGLRANASLVFSGEASPTSWSAVPNFFSPGALTYLQGDCALCFRHFFPPTDLDDGAAIIGHDSVVTATSAIRFGGVNDTPSRVAQALKRFHGPDAIPLASGWLSVGETGNAVNKAVPILQVQPDGRMDFRALGSLSGTPCLPDKGTC